MIEFTKSYQTSDGQTFALLDVAQVHQLQLLMPNLTTDSANEIVAQSAQVVDILTIRPNSKPKGRKLHGASRARKAAIPATPEAA